MGSCKSKENIQEPAFRTSPETVQVRPTMTHLFFPPVVKVSKNELKPSLFIVREVGVANEETIKSPLN
jgi:hypothetical protein